MRRLLVFLLMFSAFGMALAQGEGKSYRYASPGYFGSVRLGYGDALCVGVVNGYTFGKWFKMGVGVSTLYSIDKIVTNGVVEDEWMNLRVPIYLHLRADILDRRVTPFVALDCGGGLMYGKTRQAWDDTYELGFSGFYCVGLQAGVGVRLKGGKIIDVGVTAMLHTDRPPFYHLCGSIVFSW